MHQVMDWFVRQPRRGAATSILLTTAAARTKARLCGRSSPTRPTTCDRVGDAAIALVRYGQRLARRSESSQCPERRRVADIREESRNWRSGGFAPGGGAVHLLLLHEGSVRIPWSGGGRIAPKGDDSTLGIGVIPSTLYGGSSHTWLARGNPVPFCN